VNWNAPPSPRALVDCVLKKNSRWMSQQGCWSSWLAHMCEGIKVGGDLGVKPTGLTILGYGYNYGLIFGGGSNLVELPNIAGPSPDMAGFAIYYFFFNIRSHSLIGHFRGATWCPLIRPCGAQILAQCYPFT
jgi:hypothetical protein